MILSRLLLPEPFGPSTPIFAPGRKASVMPSTITRSGGTTLRRSCRVKTNSCAISMNSARAAPSLRAPSALAGVRGERAAESSGRAARDESGVAQQGQQARAVEATAAPALHLRVEAVHERRDGGG